MRPRPQQCPRRQWNEACACGKVGVVPPAAEAERIGEGVGAAVETDLRELVGFRNDAAKKLGFPNFHTMLTRQTWRGTVMDERQRVSIEEALQAYTEYGAFSQKQEAVKGKLKPGFLADVAVFSRDLLSASPEEILRDTRCDITIRGGQVVYERSGTA